MLEWLLNSEPDWKPNDDYNVHDATSTRWGHRFTLKRHDQETGEGSGDGHMAPRPAEGDVIVIKSQIGRMFLTVTDVDYCLDPNDMFFCDVQHVASLDPNQDEIIIPPYGEEERDERADVMYDILDKWREGERFK